MKKILIALLPLLLLFSCLEQEATSDPLCIPVICGNIDDNSANIAVFNDSGVDFDEFIFSISGQTDTVTLFPLQQFSCWYNYDTLNSHYFVAKGVSNNIVFQSDTLWQNQSDQYNRDGVFVLEVLEGASDADLDLFVQENYESSCKDI